MKTTQGILESEMPPPVGIFFFEMPCGFLHFVSIPLNLSEGFYVIETAVELKLKMLGELGHALVQLESPWWVGFYWGDFVIFWSKSAGDIAFRCGCYWLCFYNLYVSWVSHGRYTNSMTESSHCSPIWARISGGKHLHYGLPDIIMFLFMPIVGN